MQWASALVQMHVLQPNCAQQVLGAAVPYSLAYVCKAGMSCSQNKEVQLPGNNNLSLLNGIWEREREREIGTTVALTIKNNN